MLCGYALWRTRELAVAVFARTSATSLLLVFFLLLLVWGLAVVSWRFYLVAYTGQLASWRTAIRQLGLLLIGKYVPGGVFGFIARMYDQPDAPRKQLFWAGLTEQAVGVSLPMALGGVLYIAAVRHHLGWLLLVLPLPLLAVGGIQLLHHFAAGLPWLRRHAISGSPPWRKLLPATSIHLAQLLAWVTLVALLSHQLYGLDVIINVGVAGAFLLAVAAGMIVVIVPGGIGVREAILIGLLSLWLETSQAVFLTALLRLLSSMLDVFAGVVATLTGVRGKVE